MKTMTNDTLGPLNEGPNLISLSELQIANVIDNELTECLIVIDRTGELLQHIVSQLSQFRYLQHSYLQLETKTMVKLFCQKLSFNEEFSKHATIIIQDYLFTDDEKLQLFELTSNKFFRLYIVGE